MLGHSIPSTQQQYMQLAPKKVKKKKINPKTTPIFHLSVLALLVCSAWYSACGEKSSAGYMPIFVYMRCVGEQETCRRELSWAPREPKPLGYYQQTFPQFQPIPYHLIVRFCKGSKAFSSCLFWGQLMAFNTPCVTHDMRGFSTLVVIL